MKQTKEYIEVLLGRFLDGQTTEADEQVLADYFQNVETMSEEWLVYKEMFDSFKTDAYDFSQEELDAMLIPARNEKSKWCLPLWCSVACVAAIVGVFVWHHWVASLVSETPSIAQMRSLEETDVRNNDTIVTIRDTPPLLAEAAPTMIKHDKKKRKLSEQENMDKSTQPIKRPTQLAKSQGITTMELLETINLLADVGNENVTITSLPDDEGFAVRFVSYEGESNSYMLRRCGEGTSLELKSLIIDF